MAGLLLKRSRAEVRSLCEPPISTENETEVIERRNVSRIGSKHLAIASFGVCEPPRAMMHEAGFQSGGDGLPGPRLRGDYHR